MKKLKKQIALAALAVVLSIAGWAWFGKQSNTTMLQNKKALAYNVNTDCLEGGTECRVILNDKNGKTIGPVFIQKYHEDSN